MNPLNLLKHANWRIIAAAFCAAAILHIGVTLAAPQMANSHAFARLSRVLPVNAMTVLPPVTPANQPLPYMSPDARYAMCRFDSSQGTVEISAVLPEPGWTLSLHSKDGENFYIAVAQPGRITSVSLLLIPTDERFTGLTPEAKGKVRQDSVSLTLVAPHGIAVIRAPDTGHAYRAKNEAALAGARCGVRKG